MWRFRSSLACRILGKCRHCKRNNMLISPNQVGTATCDRLICFSTSATRLSICYFVVLRSSSLLLSQCSQIVTDSTKRFVELENVPSVPRFLYFGTEGVLMIMIPWSHPAGSMYIVHMTVSLPSPLLIISLVSCPLFLLLSSFDDQSAIWGVCVHFEVFITDIRTATWSCPFFFEWCDGTKLLAICNSHFSTFSGWPKRLT